MRSERVTITLAGSATTGSADTRKPLYGEFCAVFIDYTSVGGSTVVKLKDRFGDIYTAPAGNTDLFELVKHQAADSAGAKITTADRWGRRPLHGYVTVEVSASSAGTIIVEMLYR